MSNRTDNKSESLNRTPEPIPFAELSADEKRLVDAAMDAATRAYCPYSDFPVGSAVLTGDGKVFSGCNIENAAWGPSLCAERVAVSKAVSEGQLKFTHCAIVCLKKMGGWSCGMCRQFLNEFAPDIIVINVVNKDKAVLKKTLPELLPESFGPLSL